MLRMTIKLEIPEGGALVNACHCGDTCATDDCPMCYYCAAFSWQYCETCGSRAGERHSIAIIFAGTEREPEYYSACVDCVHEIEGV